jgi:iron only hydrogenase large subunit-like protein
MENKIAMLAPSFPIMFSYPEIIGKLKRLGFKYVVEVSRGAIETNKQLLELLKADPNARFVTSPCPTIVRLIRNKYPHLVKYLSPIKSPMVNTAEIIKKEYPGFTPVFIGPCINKKLEASEDHPELGITVLTYKELKTMLDENNIKDDPNDFKESFDLIGSNTRMYAISGGLTQSAELNSFLTDEELDVVSGIKNVLKALEDFPKNKLRVLDILNCDGGCISGPGIDSSLNLEQRRAKVISHWTQILR